MKRLTRLAILLTALLLSFGAGMFHGGAFAAPAPVAYLPTVRSAPPATVCDGKAPILDQDTGSLSAGLDPAGNYIIAYQDRAHGGRGVVAQHIGAHLVGLPAPALAVVDLVTGSPQFSPPDSAKVGSVALVLNGPKPRLYYTSRALDADPNIGPYALWCMEFSSVGVAGTPAKVPGPTPLSGNPSGTPLP